MLGLVTMAIAAPLFLFHPGGATKEEVCDPGWTSLTSTCFKLFREPKKWSEAQTYCEAQNGSLLSANSTPGIDRVINMTRHKNNTSSWWTGVYRITDKNTSLVDYSNSKMFFFNRTLWRKGEPNNRHAENCVELSETGLNDVKCDKQLHYICFKFATLGQDTTTNTEDCGTDWFLMHRACYKLSIHAMPWQKALENCEKDGGMLLSVSSVAELNQIKKEMRKVNNQNSWWVGLQRSSSSSEWEWLDSASPFTPRVTKWKKLEPNNAGGKEDCVEITSDGLLSDENCEEIRPFVCERHEITPRPRLDLTTDALTTTSTTTPLTTTTLTSTSTATTSTTFSTSASSSEQSSRGERQDKTASSFLPSSSPFSSSSSSSSSSPSSSTTARAETMPSTDQKKTTKATPTRPTSPRPTSPRPTSPRPTSPRVPIVNVEEVVRQEEGSSAAQDKLYELYAGCYLLDTRGSGKEGRFVYEPGSIKCPPVTAVGIEWPETNNNSNSTQKCKNQDNAYFYCGGNPVCWRGQPNVDECASPQFKKILEQVASTEDLEEAPEAEQSVALTTELVEVTKSNDVTPDDVLVTSKVITSLVTSGATKKMNNATEAKAIVENVVKAGSNLVSANKTRMWTEMPEQDKILSATSLMVAMETATVAMAEAIDEPTVIATKDENIELELHVIDVTSVLPDEKEEIVYNAQESENSFAIPLETLSHLSQGGLAKVVFMMHYSMGNFLSDVIDDDDSDKRVHADDSKVRDPTPSEVSGAGAADVKQEKPAPKLASYILSASVGGQGAVRVKLPQPVTFTMKHLTTVTGGWESLCSFWKISESKMGSWSQDGCRVVRSNASQTTCECDHMTNFAVLMAVQEVKISETHQSLLRLATIVGCVISCICLLASWITFTCFTSLQGERNSIHKNLVVCLFIAEMLFLTGIDQTQYRLVCGFIAGFLHYFFLASFLWMLLEGVHIVLMLVQVFDASRSRLPYYYASAYAPPILIIAISAGLDHQGYGTDRYCWLTTERYFIWSFAGPVAVILFANAVILVYAMTMVCRHSEYVFSGKDKNSAGGIRSWIQGAAALEVLLGLTWILGYFFLNTQTLPLAYLFTALNSLQGLFIFCFHCLLNKKARKEYRRVMKVKRRPSTTTGSGTGTHSASLAHRHKHDLSLDSPGGPSFNSRSA